MPGGQRGLLSASDSADYWGLQGLSAIIDDNTSIYVQDDTPNNDTQYRTRFYLNPNNVTMASGDILDLFTGRNGTTDVVRIQMQKTATSYQIRAGLLNDSAVWTDTSWYDIPNNWTAVEIHYQAFAYSGSLTLWLDDAQKQSLTFIDNDTRILADVRLGAQGMETGTRGTIYFDDFESRRYSYIGTLPDPGVNDPQATNAAGWFTQTYQYSTTIPHAVTNVTPETGSPDTYTYDANGNMTCRIENGVTYSHTYNAENRAASVVKRSGDCSTGTIIESWSFAYDGDGTRVMTMHFTGTQGTPDSTTAYYMGGAYEVKDGAAKKYYSIAGMMVAVNDGTAVQYLLTDHLGSVVATTNSTGTLTSQQRYLPFGAPRSIPNSPIAGTDFTYTGQRMLDSGMGGIMDFRARLYSPYINRFLQPDRFVSNPRNPQSWNRFSYVLNNPIRNIDPSGYTSVCAGANVDPECNGGTDNWTPQYGVTWWRVHTQLRFGITLSDDGGKEWDEANAELVYNSLANIDTALNGQLRSLAGGATFELDEYVPTAQCPTCEYGGWTAGTTVTFYTLGSDPIRQMNFYHEFGHLIDSLPGAMNDVFTNALIAEGNPSYVGGNGYLNPRALLSQNITNDPNYARVQALQASDDNSAEQWADIFANYVAGNINRYSSQGAEMYRFVTDVLALHVGP